MKIDIEIDTSEEYFNKTDRQIDWDENDDNKVSTKQADNLQKILTTEASIYLLRLAVGGVGHLVDNMVEIRREYINFYEQVHEPYEEYNDYY